MEDGELYEATFSKVGYISTQEGNGRFGVVVSAYDAEYDPDISQMIGHTWKKYIFFYNSEEDEIQEFAGTEVDIATADFWVGEGFVDSLVPDTDMITDISIRGNGLVVINYTVAAQAGDYFYHYIYDMEKESLVDDNGDETDDTPLSGTYALTVCPWIANYPEVPGPDDVVWYGGD